MKIDYFYSLELPWQDATMCVLGIWTLREKGQWFQIGLGLLFFTIGLHFGNPIGFGEDENPER